MQHTCYTRFHPLSFGLALGVVTGISMLLTGLFAMSTGWGAGFVETMRTIYLGYESTVRGSLIGGMWGFLDMLIMGIIIAALYNIFLRCCSRKLCRCMEKTIKNTPKNNRRTHNKTINKNKIDTDI